MTWIGPVATRKDPVTRSQRRAQEQEEDEKDKRHRMEKRASIAGATAKADRLKHKNTLDNLDRDNKALMQELALESKQDAAVNSSSASAEIKRLQDQGDSYTKKIEMERRRILELERQIKAVQKKVNAQRKKMGGVNVSKQNNLVLNKQIKVMENRLDKAIVRYNEILGKNKLIKDKIDDLRKERLIFDGIYKKLEKEMQSERRSMAKLVEDCNVAYKERDAAKREIAELQRTANEEQEAFQAEWKRLGELIEKDKRAKDLNQLPEPSGSKLGDMSHGEESALKQKIAKGTWNIGKEKIQIKRSQEKAHNYEEMFNRIQEETGVTDIDELVERFVTAEDKNFSLFTQVNGLNAEIKSLEGQIAKVEAEVEKYRGQGLNAASQRKRILVELEERLEQTNQRADEYEIKHANAQKILNQLKTGVEVMFDKLGVVDDDEEVRKMLGNEGVNDKNVMQYLGILEHRASEVLQVLANSSADSTETLQGIIAKAEQEAEETSGARSGVSSAEPPAILGEELPPPGSGTVRPDLDQVLPDLGDADEAYDCNVARPLSRGEIKASVEVALTAKQQMALAETKEADQGRPEQDDAAAEAAGS